MVNQLNPNISMSMRTFDEFRHFFVFITAGEVSVSNDANELYLKVTLAAGPGLGVDVSYL